MCQRNILDGSPVCYHIALNSALPPGSDAPGTATPRHSEFCLNCFYEARSEDKKRKKSERESERANMLLFKMSLNELFSKIHVYPHNIRL